MDRQFHYQIYDHPASPGTIYVPNSSYLALFILVAGVLLAPMALEPLFKRIIKGAPELKLAADELASDPEEE